MVEFFGVRHHSPSAARLVAERIAQSPPAAVLIEGPTEFNPHLEELFLDHELPVMLYSWAPLNPDAPEGSAEWGARRGSFYPLTQYCPEWTALRAAHTAGVPVEFMDLPWLAFAQTARAENRYAEAAPDESVAAALDTLLHEFGVDDLAALSDELFDIDPHLDLQTYQLRAGLLGSVLRGPADAETEAREAHMAARIVEATDRFGPDILVVCGAAHIDGLRARLARSPEPVAPWYPPTDDERYGIALTPTSYAALDALEGYDAGQPHPGFYDELFTDRAAGRHNTAERLLGRVVAGLRRKKQHISPADLIAVRATAGALAQLRNHPQVWRTDLVEAIATALVKDDSGSEHPLLRQVQYLLRGDKVGKLADGTRQPPLTVELRTALDALELTPTPQGRQELADLATEVGLARSRLAHSLVELQVPGFALTASADEDGVERWQVRWSPSFEGALVEAARYGGTREQAVTARLLERAANVVDDPQAAAELVLDAALCGVAQLSTSLQARTETLLAASLSVRSVAAAVAVLMRLYRYDPILRATGRADLGRLVATGFDRGVRLLERLQPVPEGPDLEGFITALRQLTDTAERVGSELGLDREGFHTALSVVVGDDRQAPTVRGAALGAQWLAAMRPEEEIAELLGVIAVPSQLGDFVAGLLGVAREAALRQPTAMQRLDELLTALSSDEFFDALPGLRRAFSRYTPRERAQVADIVLGEDANAWALSFAGSVEDAAEIAHFEAALAGALEKFLGVK
ncbi:hypothetical protein EII12_03485 [Buchananella hordeovulneris]|uniref:DUF5682 family protein n=1 Tax=Buchananella hordeovulneris TaxID=52770 RepID=UPI000F5E6432|nr:DUF5682 family protein [Buchananella hordeovulneris]RRD52949.1 hypothetical protein EII12_03485 [Buchananella hordeovulneris]